MQGNDTTTPKLMRAKDACLQLGISRWTLNTLASAGEVRTVKIASQKRYLIEDIEKLTDPNRDSSVELVSPAAAAEMIGGVSARTVVRMAERGKIRSVRTPGGHRRVYAGDVMRLLTLDKGVNHVGAESNKGSGHPNQ